MSIRYPNANYPQAYDEANMQKATDVDVNVAANNLTVTEAAAGYGPLLETAVTGADVDTDPRKFTAPAAAPEASEPEALATEDL